jgi:hypothetical protein
MDWNDGAGALTSYFEYSQNAAKQTVTDSAALLSNSSLQCMAKASDCDGVKACLKASGQQLAKCETGSWKNFCDGEVLVECDQKSDLLRCADAGLKCLATAYDSAACGLRTCALGEKASCSGNTLLKCSYSGVVVMEDCALRGGICAVDENEGAVCTGTGAACTTEGDDFFYERCEGTIRVECFNGHESRRDCEKEFQGSTCVMLSSYVAGCDFTKSDCDGSEPEGCEGKVISYCDYRGKKATIDCGAFGFSACGTMRRASQTVAKCEL